MSLLLTLLLACIQVVQAQSTLPIEDLKKEGALQGLHQALDDRFSTGGGTITGSVNLGSSVTIANTWTQNGPAIFYGSATFNTPVVLNASTTFNGGVFGTINASTGTLINTNITISGTAMGPCLAGTTVYLVTNAAKVMVTFNGALDADNSTSNAVLAFLVDGAFPTGVTSAVGLATARDRGAGFAVPEQVGWEYLTRTSLSAGSHSFCITAHGGSGSSAVLTCDSSGSLCNFQVTEFR